MTIWLVQQCLNQLRNHVPTLVVIVWIVIRTTSDFFFCNYMLFIQMCIKEAQTLRVMVTVYTELCGRFCENWTSRWNGYNFRFESGIVWFRISASATAILWRSSISPGGCSVISDIGTCRSISRSLLRARYHMHVTTFSLTHARYHILVTAFSLSHARYHILVTIFSLPHSRYHILVTTCALPHTRYHSYTRHFRY